MPKKIIALLDGTWNNNIEGNTQTNINALKLSISSKDKLNSITLELEKILER